MNQTVKIVIAGAIGLAAGLAIGLMIKSSKEEEEEWQEVAIEEEEQSEQKVEKKERDFLAKGDDFPLALGSSGRRVERLQVYLFRKLGGIAKPSGVFDEATEKRVEQCFKKKEVAQELYETLQLDKMLHDQRRVKR